MSKWKNHRVKGGKNQRSDDLMFRKKDSFLTSSDSNFTTENAAQEWHFDIRRAVRCALEEETFVDYCKACNNSCDNADIITVEQVIEPICAACDEHVYELPTKNPINFETLSRDIKQIISEHLKISDTEVASDKFTSTFMSRAKNFLVKKEPIHISKKKDVINLKQSRTEDNKSNYPEKRVRDIGIKYKIGNEIDCNSNIVVKDNDNFPAETTSVLGSSYDNYEHKDVYLSNQFPNNNLKYNPLNRINVDDTPVVLDSSSFYSFKEKKPVLGFYPSTNNTSSCVINNSAVLSTDVTFNHNSKTSTSVFAEKRIKEPANDIGTRFIAIDNLPSHINTNESLKETIEFLAKALSKGSFWLNYTVISKNNNKNGCNVNSNDNENDKATVLANHTGIVSFNSNKAASEMVNIINEISSRDGTCVNARAATAEEVEFLWGSMKKVMEQAEFNVIEELKLYEQRQLTNLYKQLNSINVVINERKLKIAAMQKEEGPTTIEEKKQELSSLLRLQLASLKQKEEIGAMITKRGYDPKDVTSLPDEDKYSSSKAVLGPPGNLIYLVNLPDKLTDDKVLIVLKHLDVQVVHIWRLPNSNDLCMQLHNPGAVFGLLRKLDCLDFIFVGIEFSKKKKN